MNNKCLLAKSYKRNRSHWNKMQNNSSKMEIHWPHPKTEKHYHTKITALGEETKRNTGKEH